MEWIGVDQQKPEYGARILAFSPAYPEGDPMRFRIVSWIINMSEVTHWCRVTPPVNP